MGLYAKYIANFTLLFDDNQRRKRQGEKAISADTGDEYILWS